MRKTLQLFCFLLLPNLTLGQTPFTALWSFDADSKVGSSTSASIMVSDMATNFVNVPGVVSIAYVTGQSGKAVNVQNWSTTGCDNNEYVSFTITPASGAKLTVTQFSLYFNRSASGPTFFKIRSSADNFASDLYSQVPTSSFQQTTVSVSNIVDQTGPVTFRIYACSATASGGTIRLDEVTINGTVLADPLPVTLLYFTAQPDGDRVQLAWATTSELNASQFTVEHSLDLQEFISIGNVTARGITNERQYYGLTDMNPTPGTNYYRLKQIDRDGTTQVFKPISAIIRVEEPVVSIYPNPAEGGQIHLRLWNADNATLRLLTTTGQVMNGQLNRLPGEATFLPVQPLAAGVYFVESVVNGKRRIGRVLVR